MHNIFGVNTGPPSSYFSTLQHARPLRSDRRTYFLPLHRAHRQITTTSSRSGRSHMDFHRIFPTNTCTTRSGLFPLRRRARRAFYSSLLFPPRVNRPRGRCFSQLPRMFASDTIVGFYFLMKDS